MKGRDNTCAGLILRATYLGVKEFSLSAEATCTPTTIKVHRPLSFHTNLLPYGNLISTLAGHIINSLAAYSCLPAYGSATLQFGSVTAIESSMLACDNGENVKWIQRCCDVREIPVTIQLRSGPMPLDGTVSLSTQFTD